MGPSPRSQKERRPTTAKNVPQACSEAADAILEADVLLLRRLAGPPSLSHRDIANVKAYAERDLTYRELCVMWLGDEPALPFWPVL